MIETEKKLIYKAFGLTLTSEIPLPELPHLDSEICSIDVEIVKGDLSKLWFELSDEENAFVIKENFVMFQVPNIATFSIQEGKRITVSPLKEDEENHIRLYILGTCMGAILMQRKVLPLHGSAVAINGKAYAFMGNSGAGKSTLASAFLNQGYKLLSDDVIAVSLSKEEDIPFVTPSYPHQKLWDDSLSSLGMEVSNFRPIYGREAKYSIPVSSKYFTEPLPLGGVFELIKSENSEFDIRRIDSLERFHTLYYNTYQNCFIPNLGLMAWHFNTTTKIINKIGIYQIQRPVSGTSPTQMVAQILKTLSEGE
ncbi:aldolase [Neobacillus ginsengisoli]|uniref:Aldolase n=1 Tax=Neobacillus ginsengisoli TaxID=904295 RepID=A0ABT9XTB2_9BACI|nr:aldolase [Neobacillus ginsengisoli]MDQ0198799.1 hypothetical protein [Neobacillus ginsengisoli]